MQKIFPRFHARLSLVQSIASPPRSIIRGAWYERRRRIHDHDRDFHETRRIMDGEEQAGAARKEIRPDLHRGGDAVRPVDRVHGFLSLLRRF